MALDARSQILRQLGFVVATWRDDPRTDIELLTRFVQTRDEQAFSAIVGRYSQLVWGTCRRILANSADAEDALQATFLRLARDARRIVNRQALASWLFRAARGCAIDLRRMIERQRCIEERLAVVAERVGESTAQTNLRLLLDDELAQLTERERIVIILCCLEDRTYADVALELGCSVAAVHRRLVRAQTRLRRRLARHGSTVVTALTGGATLLGSRDLSAAPSAALARTVEQGVDVARTGLLPTTRAGTLAICSMLPSKTAVSVIGLAIPLLVVCLLVGSFGRGESEILPAEPAQAASPETNRDPQFIVSGVVRDPSGAVLPGATVAAMARRPFGPGERGLRDEVLATTTADANGRFQLPLADPFETWFSDRIVTIQASAGGYASVSCPVRLAAAAPIEMQVKSPVALRGRFVGPSGCPAAGVPVEVVRVGDVVAEPVIGEARSPLPPAWPAAVVTDENGAFELPAVGASTNVWVRVNDPRFALDTFRVDRDGPREIRLDEARELAIEVRGADTGCLLPGARITVITERLRSHPHYCTTEHGITGPQTVPADIDAIADARGSFRVGVARGDRVELLVHPPAGAEPYLGIRSWIEVGDDPTGRSIAVQLPLGRWVNGIAIDETTGQPLAGAAMHWGRHNATKPEWRDDILLGRDAIARTGPDGTFRFAVLPGPCSIRVHGPTLAYQSVPARVCGTTNTTLFAHRIQPIEVPAQGEIAPLRVALAAGTSIAGRVDHPRGANNTTFLLCSGRVSPVRPYAGLSIPVRNSLFAVPGCRLDHSTRVYVFDPVERVGAVIDVAVGQPAPVAKLEPCGRIRVRAVGTDGRPQSGVEVSLSLMLDRDCPIGAVARDRPSDPQPIEWFDAVNSGTRPRTDAAGFADLPALIPGARYAVAVGTGTGKVSLGTVLIPSGETITLPDAVLPPAADSRPTPGGMR